MHLRKLLNRFVAVLMIISLLLSAGVPMMAQGPATDKALGYYKDKIEKTKEKIDHRVTQAERQAAADRAAAAGFELAAAEDAGVSAQALPGEAPRYFSHPNYANSPLPAADPDTGAISGGIKKFVDALPWGPDGAPLPVAVPVVLTAPDSTESDYLEIGLVQYRQQMHTDLPPTLLRGYVQIAGPVPCEPGTVELFNENLDPAVAAVSTGFCGVTAPSYLGPAIVAQKDVALRILFRNLLPAGAGGDLFIPTDTSVMGSGMGPDLHGMPEVDPQLPTCETDPKPLGCFTENRADLHLHGGLTPWISDGTPHQWITPAGETLPYPDDVLLGDPTHVDYENAFENKGVSVEYVPDMWYDATGAWIDECFGSTTCAVAGATNNPGKGAQTYYYTNQQSARLLFYHDHAWGITRLNVYAGEAAPYIIQDETELALTGTDGALDGLGMGIPLVIQDKTFVPSAEQLAVSDETWDEARWGGEGNLWLPHVYSPAQNPGDSSGVNQFGRWAYGPWFWPPTSNILYGPIQNPYYDPNCDPDVQWCEPQMMPGTPWNSMGMEAFHDTPLVNGMAYPTVTLDPIEYRFRVLNAASDRSFNLSLYQAVDANGVLCTDSLAAAPESTGVACTEVALNPAEVAAALEDPTVFPTPLTGTEGPAWVQFGTEGGFLPAPVVLPAQPTTWVNDPTVFNAGNVDKHSLLLGPAERADVVVDFTQFAGQTLILYNDAPAAFPARDPRYDYYTGNGDYVDTGGAPSTLPGYGPNTRTVMRIVVTGTPVAPDPAYPGYNATRKAALDTAFKATSLGGGGVFETSQNPIIVGQGAYNSAYGTNFRNSGALDGFARITDFSLTFRTLYNWAAGNTMTMQFQTKAIQDEMGEAFDRDYGRMSGNLGLERPLTDAGVLQNLILYPFVNPVSELIDTTLLPKTSDVDPLYEVAPISVAADGTQIWKITHNGVDTHPIHFHLFDVQILNRVGWDGIIRPPDANELGWKDTVRISPLEDTIVALRPIIPVTPFDNVLPNSERPLNPAMPTGSTLMFTNVDANAQPTTPIVNVWTNFGWEYVWHCHILSHEEMDMMRPISVAGQPVAPFLEGVRGTGRQDSLTWSDPSNTETAIVVQSGPTTSGPWTDLVSLPANTTSYSYRAPNQTIFYRVLAVNTVGYGATAGYSTMTTTGVSNVLQLPSDATLPPAPAAPTGLTATVQTGPQVLLTWTDNATNETGFAIERAIITAGIQGAWAPLASTGPRNNVGAVSFTDVTVQAGTTYIYQVKAVNAGGSSAYSISNQVAVPNVPPAPANVRATAVRRGGNARVTLNWLQALDSNETGFVIQWSTNPGFTANLVTATVGENVLTYSTGNVARNTSFYFRVAAFNAAGQSVWTNASPFPITTP
jgi:FtsP/CotA-like multicopper oxidase with cupredoxin domain